MWVVHTQQWLSDIHNPRSMRLDQVQHWMNDMHWPCPWLISPGRYRLLLADVACPMCKWLWCLSLAAIAFLIRTNYERFYLPFVGAVVACQMQTCRVLCVQGNINVDVTRLRPTCHILYVAHSELLILLRGFLLKWVQIIFLVIHNEHVKSKYARSKEPAHTSFP